MIRILDCTLRDGGYINNFNFGKRAIASIISKLAESNIDMIECGFLSDKEYDENKTVFSSLDQVKNIIGKKNPNVTYIGMIALGEKEISGEKIPPYDNLSVDAIRITFHKNEKDQALKLCLHLMDKGYKIFMQPIGTSTYTDSELLDLIRDINAVEPYAFAIVDTLGTMYKNELIRLYHLFDHNLSKNISIGFHSHNNLQLSFSNAQALLHLPSRRNIIIDSSVFGMGRGAGNLCTELLTQYINDNIIEKYNVIPLLEIIDEYISPIFKMTPWGYSVPYYLSATYNCHPNYASHLLNKQTISVKTIDILLNRIPNTERAIYNKALIENIYLAYQNREVDDQSVLDALAILMKDRPVLVIAPGKSIHDEDLKIKSYITQNNPAIISVNFGYTEILSDFVFVSNAKRYEANRSIFTEGSIKVILTSNIHEDNVYPSHYTVNYSSLLNDNPSISDNAGMMLLNLLAKLSVNEIILAGFDGFSEKVEENYYKTDLINSAETSELKLKNEYIKSFLDELKKTVRLKFLTKSIYE